MWPIPPAINTLHTREPVPILYTKEFIIKMEGNTAEFSDISGSEIH